MKKGKGTRSRAWMVTIFEQPEGMEKPRTEEDVDEILTGLRWCGQLEEGHKTHHRHFQLYVEAPNAIRFSTWKGSARMHMLSQGRGRKNRRLPT